MKITYEIKGDVAIIDTQGNSMSGSDASLLNDTLKEIIEENVVNVVMDVSAVSWINTSGIGIIIGGLTVMRNAGGDLRLAQITERIDELLMKSSLKSVFDIYETVEDAVESFH